ncbi:myeloid cell surface antigen CD33-like isoform X2 [Hoplias malabaricus]|uniref:myeloid cell surface antigen CD33-like isoform X2 n=1 Tax=Hoplias malabaricus TaxID=27720 RepID=UPI00346336B0
MRELITEEQIPVSFTQTAPSFLYSLLKMKGKLVLLWLCLQAIFTTGFSEDWTAQVVPDMKALVESCVVVPCTFNYPGKKESASRIRGIWHKKDDKKINIYHEDSTLISDNFKGRTKLPGHLGAPDHNCTLEIDEVKDHDNGPYCFRAELIEADKFSFVEKCVLFTMIQRPDPPEVQEPETLEEGVPTTLKCFVKHTCPSHPPTLTWSNKDGKVMMSSRSLGNGNWEVESLLTVTPTEADDHTKITCNVSFHGGLKSFKSIPIYIKRKTSYVHIIAPVLAVAGTALLFGGVCFFVTKKYKRQIQELRSRNENGVFSRISRISRRIRSVD